MKTEWFLCDLIRIFYKSKCYIYWIGLVEKLLKVFKIYYSSLGFIFLLKVWVSQYFFVYFFNI